VVILYYMILTAFKKYWPDTVAKFISGTQETFIIIHRIIQHFIIRMNFLKQIIKNNKNM
jgi:hypothetical protein